MPHTNGLAAVVQRGAKGFIVTGHDIDLAAWLVKREPWTSRAVCREYSPPAMLPWVDEGFYRVAQYALRWEMVQFCDAGRRRFADA